MPSCLESGLSGVMLQDLSSVWYTREFSVPAQWQGDNRRVLINFEAVDYEATVFVNGQKAGFHRGGFWHFSVDVTKYLRSNGTNSLYVAFCGSRKATRCFELCR